MMKQKSRVKAGFVIKKTKRIYCYHLPGVMTLAENPSSMTAQTASMISLNFGNMDSVRVPIKSRASKG